MHSCSSSETDHLVTLHCEVHKRRHASTPLLRNFCNRMGESGNVARYQGVQGLDNAGHIPNTSMLHAKVKFEVLATGHDSVYTVQVPLMTPPRLLPDVICKLTFHVDLAG